MKKVIKRSLFVAAGLCWLAFAAGIGCFLLSYLIAGAGVPFPAILGIGAPLLGMVHIIGFAVIAGICFVIGAGLCIRGMTLAPESAKGGDNRSAGL